MRTVSFPLPLLREGLRLLARGHRRAVRFPLGVARTGSDVDWLVRTSGPASAPGICVLLGNDPSPPELAAHTPVLLRFSSGVGRGHVECLARAGTGVVAVDRLHVVGSGMHVVSLTGRSSPEHEASVHARFSRTIGALGRDTWERLRRLRVAVIGVGRTGSQVVRLLAGAGIRDLVLIDPDVVEVHNLGEMGELADSDVGTPKVDAVARTLAGCSTVRVRTMRSSITHLRALQAAKRCDAMFGCVDHDSARWAASVVAALYNKPLLDVATGVHRTGDRRRLGATVRLVLPGRCLLCLGGLVDEEGALEALASPEAERRVYATRDWREERAGSLRSLNDLAAATAVRLWEDLVAARVDESRWVQLDHDRVGRLSVRTPRPATPTSGCALCDVAGAGDDGLPLVRDLLGERRASLLRRRPGRTQS